MFYSRIAVALSAILFASVAAAAPGDTSVVSTPSTATKGSSFAAISGNGRYVLYFADLAGKPVNSLYVRDLQTDQTDEVTVSDASVSGGRAQLEEIGISDNGRLVTFASDATNLVSAPDTNDFLDVFVRDRTAHTTVRLDDVPGQQNDAAQVPHISGDGRFVTYQSQSGGRLYTVGSGNNQPILDSGVMSFSGQYVAFGTTVGFDPTDLNGVVDIYVLDRQTSKIEWISKDPNGGGSFTFPQISGNGRYVAFRTTSSMGNAQDSNGAQDIYVRDRQMQATQLVSVALDGLAAGVSTSGPSDLSISADGRYVAFVSGASNLVAGDTNATSDAFVRDRIGGVTQRVSVGSGGTQANGPSGVPSLSADGSRVAFNSVALNLPGSVGGQVHDRTYVHESTFPASSVVLLSYSLSYPSQTRNTQSASKRVIVRNVSNVAVPVTGVRIVGQNPSQFTHTTSCGSTLAAGANCAVAVVFAPTSLGGKKAVLNVNGGGGGLRTVALSGVGK